MRKIMMLLVITAFGAFLFVNQPVLAASYESDVGLTFEGYEPTTNKPGDNTNSGGETPTPTDTNTPSGGTDTGPNNGTGALPETGDTASVSPIIFGAGFVLLGIYLLFRKAKRGRTHV
ncbi:LPXTG cell wall anchor domain-containing protein [Listeria weihenstephanensis]|uniref:LPXTG cell wall anchor domain-containing protein n=1 Tax=Listeria weihenstephanensis TaxID=1006155 RepID=A0A841Z812_9LIST|nr:LPXTG cell wall anchor domain-containing protein [Listeria weihenstephanensis]MBC1501328.1 LPXTG cell wall anchor domain-containing protein [Listeria weihenstephanensis]